VNHQRHCLAQKGPFLLRFGMLKQWVQNQSIAEIDVEEKWVSWVSSLRSDRYVTVSRLKHVNMIMYS